MNDPSVKSEVFWLGVDGVAINVCTSWLLVANAKSGYSNFKLGMIYGNIGSTAGVESSIPYEPSMCIRFGAWGLQVRSPRVRDDYTGMSDLL